jgi:hypothetical protein
MTKGLDASFVHYGIRRADLDLLEALAGKHQLDFEWIQEEILKKFHEARAADRDLDEKALCKLLEKALGKLEA